MSQVRFRAFSRYLNTKFRFSDYLGVLYRNVGQGQAEDRAELLWVPESELGRGVADSARKCSGPTWRFRQPLAEARRSALPAYLQEQVGQGLCKPWRLF